MPNPFELHASDAQTFPVPGDAPAAATITPAQAAFLTSLMTRKAALVNGDADKIAPWVNGLSKSAASARIDEAQAWLKEYDRVAADVAGSIAAPAVTGTPDAEAVPAGRYAVDTADGATNALAFYIVDRPTDGKWAGRVFVKLITGGDVRRLSWATSTAVLAKIAAVGAEAAMTRYGREIGNCGHCGRQLTNDESRAVGIGPVCRAKMGF